MLSLIILIIFGLFVAYFATMNTGAVHILLGNYMLSNIPLYFIVIGSVLLGICISWLINLTNAISSNITLHGKDNALKRAQQTIDTLRTENHTLELEVARMEGQESLHLNKDTHQNDQHEESKSTFHPSVFYRVRHIFD